MNQPVRPANPDTPTTLILLWIMTSLLPIGIMLNSAGTVKEAFLGLLLMGLGSTGLVAACVTQAIITTLNRK